MSQRQPSSAVTSLWRHHDFRLLFAAATVTNFGSMIRRIALPFTAILVLDATPADIAVLTACGLLPGFVVGLFAGAAIDRMRRRPLLIASDLLRAVVLLSVPVAAYLGVLRMAHLYGVALVSGLLSFLFTVAHTSYLPSLVEKKQLVEANSKLKAAEAITEGAGFASGGWLVQLLTAPVALLVDSLTFLGSAGLLMRIRTPEPVPETRPSRGMLREIASGVGQVIGSRLLLPLFGAGVLSMASFQILGVAYLLFVNQELGFSPGVLGVIFAVGAGSSLLGAIGTERATRAVGLGHTLWLGMALIGVSSLLIPLASGATMLGAMLLVAHQLGDGGAIVHDVNAVSVRQAITPKEILGRVNATFHFAALGAMLLGTALGGVLGETVGLRATLVIGAAGFFLATGWLVVSPIRRLRTLPEAGTLAST